jgi:hypothetical protein
MNQGCRQPSHNPFKGARIYAEGAYCTRRGRDVTGDRAYVVAPANYTFKRQAIAYLLGSLVVRSASICLIVACAQCLSVASNFA